MFQVNEKDSLARPLRCVKGLSEEIIRDAAAIDLDAFAKDRFPVPHDSAIEIVTKDHAHIATMPYAAQAAEEEELLQQELFLKATRNAQTQGAINRRQSRAAPKKIKSK